MTYQTAEHAALMDETYRYQRLIYDASRRFFLFGRDVLIERLAPPAEGHVLEVACGTGRNLARIARRHPGRALYGFDISSQMLRSAKAKLGASANLTFGDATRFDTHQLFRRSGFDRVVLSYCLSMIPDWEAALIAALDATAPGGEVHIVDFGMGARYPGWFRSLFGRWLARFHVARRSTLPQAVHSAAAVRGWQAEVTDLYGGYAVLAVIRRP